MSYTQNDLILLKQKNKKVRIKVTLLDEEAQEIENLTGSIRSVSYNIDAESDIRRTCSLSMNIRTKQQIPIDFKNVWNRRMVQLSCGIFDNAQDDYVWYDLGKMLMKDGGTTFNATEQEVHFSLVDLMASLNEIRGYQLGSGHMIPAGSNIREAMIATLGDYATFKLNNIVEFDEDVPYDLVTESGNYPFQIFKSMLDLYPQYEMFYSANARFTVQEIPTKVSDPVDIDYDVLDDLIISENSSIDFTQVKNTTEIWGMQLDAMYTATECTTSGSQYNLTIDESFETLVPGETYGFTPDTNSKTNQTIKIQNTAACPIYTNPEGTTYTPITADAMVANRPYVVKYERIVLGVDETETGVFLLQGELDIHVIYQEITEMPDAEEQQRYKEANACRDVVWSVNANSQFAAYLDPTTGRIMGEMRQVLQGGEYDAIYTNDLAMQRASYETWLKCRMQDNVEIEIILIPWMDVNDKIAYHSPVDGTLNTWITKRIDYDFTNWTMMVTASRFYPLYPFYPYQEVDN